MDKIEIDSKIIEGRTIRILQASDYKEVTVDGHSIFVSSALTPEFEREFVKLTDKKGEYCGLVVIPCIAGALNDDKLQGWIAGMKNAEGIFEKLTKGGDEKAKSNVS